MALGKRISHITGTQQRNAGKRLSRWGRRDYYEGVAQHGVKAGSGTAMFKSAQHYSHRGAQLTHEGNKRGMATVAGVAAVGATAYGAHKLYKAHQVKTQNPNHAHAFHTTRIRSGA